MRPGTTKAQFQSMMQNLLAQRFHLEAHRQTRNFPGYELVIAKGGPKFKESADQAQAEIPGAPEAPKRGADGRIVLPPGPQMLTSLGGGMVRVQVQQKPIADLVKGMGRLIADSMGESPGDFASPKPRVIDKTDLTSVYDFTLEFACEGCASLSGIVSVNGGAPAPAAPADTSGATLPNIFGALEKQLGLRLERTKNIPLDVIVIDHADKIPTAN